MLLVYTKKRPTIYILYLGNKKLPINKRVYAFGTPSDLSKHFRRKHLSNLKAGERIKCGVCKISLDDKVHLRGYALSIHGTVS